MAFFDFVRKPAFFKNRNTQEITQDDLDFNKWIQAHRDWRQKLTNYINGHSQETLDETVVCRDDHCLLGQWIHGNGAKYYGDLDTFQNMRHHHAQFHTCAGDVIHSFKTQGLTAAKKLLHSDFDQNSLLVVSDLHSLESKISH